MPTWHSTNGLRRNSENKEKTKDTKKRSPAFWRPLLVYPGYPPLGVPADLKSAVKKMFNLLNPGICNPVNKQKRSGLQIRKINRSNIF